MYCVYRVTNNLNGNTYIGQHKYTDESNPMGKYKGSGFNLCRAYKKYGIKNFSTEILYQRIRDKATVDAMEIWAIAKYKPEYNIAKGGQGGALFEGHKHSDKVKQAISESSKARWADDNYRNRVIASRKATYATDEYKLKASIARKGYKQTEDWVYKRTRCAIGNRNVSETKWFNNGTINIRLKPSDIIPEGFIPGRMYFHRRRRK